MFLGPMFLCFIVFLVFPVIGTVWWSTRSGSIFGGTQFVGLDNFLQLPGVVGAGSSIQNTLVFALLSVPLILIGALGVALILARIERGGSIYRFLVYFPVLVPGVVAALIWLFLTNVDFGLFNDVIKAFGGLPVTWLGADNALTVLAVLDVWRNVGLLGDVLRGRESSACPPSFTRQRNSMAPPLLPASAISPCRCCAGSSSSPSSSPRSGACRSSTPLSFSPMAGPGTATTHGHLSRLALRLRLQQQGRLRLGDLAGPDPRHLGVDLDSDAPAAQSARHRLMTQALDAPAAIGGMNPKRIAADHARVRRRRRRRNELARHCVLALVTFILVAPFYYVFLASLKNATEIFSYPPKLLPIPPYFGNYEKLLWDTGFLRWMFNTLFVAGSVTTLKIFLDSMAGYALAKIEIAGKRAIFMLMLILLMVPIGALIVPLCVAGLQPRSHQYLSGADPAATCQSARRHLMRQFILGLPRDLENAARLDGLNEFAIYWRIVPAAE